MSDMDELRARIQAGLRSHGIDPLASDMVGHVEATLAVMTNGAVTVFCPLCHALPTVVMGDVALCGNEECKTLFWNRTKTLDELLIDTGFTDLRLHMNPPGSTGWNEAGEDPETELNWPGGA